MGCRQFNLINNSTRCTAIVQGEYMSPDRLTLIAEGDLSSGTPYGRIRNNYAEENGTILGEFSFLPMTYDISTDKTTLPVFLPADVSALLPYTKFQGGDDEPSKRNCWMYEIGVIMSPTVNRVLVANSFIQVIPSI